MLYGVPVLDKTWNKALLRRSRATTDKKCTKKRDARAKFLFCQSKAVAFFAVLVAVAVAVAVAVVVGYVFESRFSARMI